MKTANDIFRDVLTETGFGNYKPSEMSNSDYWMCTNKAMVEFAKLHVEQALKLASEKADLLKESNYGRYENINPNEVPDFNTVKEIKNNHFGHGDCNYEIITVDKKSIITAYPIENIK